MRMDGGGRSGGLLSVIMLIAAAVISAGCGSGGNNGGLNGGNNSAGVVYTLTNATAANGVSVFRRSASGALTLVNTVSTGGRGSGGGLESQGAIVLSRDGSRLFAVNAGSNEVSSFTVTGETLILANTVPSGGTLPISVTSSGTLLYVLNGSSAGANIAGFTIAPDGKLTALANSVRTLGAVSPLPAQVEFSPDGKLLAVTERQTNLVKLFTIGQDGMASGPVQNVSAGVSPFGFAFDQTTGRLFVSEAHNGQTNLSTASSYTVAADGTLQAVSGAVGTLQSDACWLALTPDSRFAYVANTGSGSISGFAIGPTGALTRLTADGRTADVGAASIPLDLAVDAGGRYLYVLAVGRGAIQGYSIAQDGSLTSIGAITGVPGSAAGLAAR
jgi:6-phosphogluconolactonase